MALSELRTPAVASELPWMAPPEPAGSATVTPNNTLQIAPSYMRKHAASTVARAENVRNARMSGANRDSSRMVMSRNQQEGAMQEKKRQKKVVGSTGGSLLLLPPRKTR